MDTIVTKKLDLLEKAELCCSQKPVSASDLSKYKLTSDAFSVSLAFATLKVLGNLIKKAKKDLEKGKTEYEVYHNFDVKALIDYLLFHRKVATDVLASYANSEEEDKIIASVFVASSIVCINSTNPLTARFILAEILNRADKDESFKHTAELVLHSIIDLADSISEYPGMDDTHTLASLGDCCRRRFMQLQD